MKTDRKKWTASLFLIYLLVLSWAILLKMQVDLSLMKDMDLRNINLIPFGDPLIVNGRVDVSEMMFNFAAFVPFGVYLSMLCGRWTFVQKALPIFAVSLSYEVLQYLFRIGTSDITDLIANTLGGMVGIGVFVVFEKLLGEKTIRILNLLATIGTVGVVFFLGLVIVATN